ncbi:hypothetical protein [Phenylobacterium sp.]|jgi:hypothetical protein|uniref:class I SAM-dependent methyltransferase n=1 Tax=Phenylobacterium sp. TaxID=1871053 RepID=UPI002F3EB71D
MTQAGDKPGGGGEAGRRKAVIDKGETDRARWTDPAQLDPAWDGRAALAAQHIPRGATVLDLGCGAMALERVLPEGCRYIPCDLAQRDERTIVCDFNAGEFPAGVAADLVTVLGVVEYLYDAPAFLKRLRGLGRTVVMSYCVAGGRGPADRRALGWVNDFTQDQLIGLLSAAGFARITGREINPGQFLLRLTTEPVRVTPERDVWVVSYASLPNFGDRLGVQLLPSLLPDNARVTHVDLGALDAAPTGKPDLMILGLGNSLFQPLLTDELSRLIDRAGRTVGVFGTQYRASLDAARLGAVLDRLESWWARSEEDLLLYGAGRANMRHLGDWLIEAFPLARWTRDETLEVGAEALSDAPLDRLIARYQQSRRVVSPRLHPLLCAMTAAEEVAYVEQVGADGGEASSGKFRSLLLDLFGRDLPERQMIPVERDAVRIYKAKVRRNVEALRAELSRILA